MLQWGLQRRLKACLLLVAEGSLTTWGRARTIWQRDSDFWDFCSFFHGLSYDSLPLFTFQDSIRFTLLHSLPIIMTAKFWRVRNKGTQKSFRSSSFQRSQKHVKVLLYRPERTPGLTSESAAEFIFCLRKCWHNIMVLYRMLCLSIHMGKYTCNAFFPENSAQWAQKIPEIQLTLRNHLSFFLYRVF